jgi:hypothetical protein
MLLTFELYGRAGRHRPSVSRAESIKERSRDVIDRAISIDRDQQTVTLEATQDRQRLALECVEPLANTRSCVVTSASPRKSLSGDLVGDGQLDRGVEAIRREPLDEPVELVEVPRKAIEQEPAPPGIGLLETPVDQLVDEPIGNQPPGGNALADAQTEWCRECDGLAQQVTSRDVGNPERSRQTQGLRTFAGSRRTDDEQSRRLEGAPELARARSARHSCPMRGGLAARCASETMSSSLSRDQRCRSRSRHISAWLIGTRVVELKGLK